jgi:hypothetical protein
MCATPFVLPSQQPVSAVGCAPARARRVCYCCTAVDDRSSIESELRRVRRDAAAARVHRCAAAQGAQRALQVCSGALVARAANAGLDSCTRTLTLAIIERLQPHGAAIGTNNAVNTRWCRVSCSSTIQPPIRTPNAAQACRAAALGRTLRERATCARDLRAGCKIGSSR